jgi:hypothetical protein
MVSEKISVFFPYGDGHFITTDWLVKNINPEKMPNRVVFTRK